MNRATGVVLALGLAVVALLVVSSIRTSSTRDGELAFSAESVDLGRIPFDQNAPARYEMRNVGDRPVKIGKPTIAAVEGC